MKFTTSLAGFAVAVLSVVSAQSLFPDSFANLTSCHTTPVQLTETSSSISPSPLCIDKTSCLTLTGTLSAPVVQGAKLAVTVRYLGRLIYTDGADLCEVLAANGTPCPVAAGPVTLNICRNVKPPLIPNVVLAWQYVATNGDGGLLACKSGFINSVICP